MFWGRIMPLFIFTEIQRISIEIGYRGIAKRTGGQYSLWHFTIGGIFK
jgi:hypothetical protein